MAGAPQIPGAGRTPAPQAGLSETAVLTCVCAEPDGQEALRSGGAVTDSRRLGPGGGREWPGAGQRSVMSAEEGWRSRQRPRGGKDSLAERVARPGGAGESRRLHKGACHRPLPRVCRSPLPWVGVSPPPATARVGGEPCDCKPPSAAGGEAAGPRSPVAGLCVGSSRGVHWGARRL